ncbi:hypothetical protein OAP64_06055 [Flavobacteriaceae bacterium]|nr:hypothetical protein [Flavobacteriaceae bacterium]
MDLLKLCLIRKSLFLNLILFGILSCSEKELAEVVPIICTVDYVQFLDAGTVIVKFDTTVFGSKESYTITQGYKTVQGNYLIGDELVRIENFSSKGTKASFDFYYDTKLGFFCANLFDIIPEHTHDDFEAEAELETTSKVVGKWKIKRKKSITK